MHLSRIGYQKLGITLMINNQKRGGERMDPYGLVGKLTLDKTLIEFRIYTEDGSYEVIDENTLIEEICYPIKSDLLEMPDYGVKGFLRNTGVTHKKIFYIDPLGCDILYITGMTFETRDNPVYNQRLRLNHSWSTYWEDLKMGYYTQVVRK